MARLSLAAAFAVASVVANAASALAAAPGDPATPATSPPPPSDPPPADPPPADQPPAVDPNVPTESPEEKGAPVPPEPSPGITPAPGAPSDPTTNEADKRIGVGIDAVFVWPVGDFANSTGALGGPLLRFGYRVVPTIELSVRAGYLFAVSKDQGGGVVSKLDVLPVWLEARWLFLNPFSGPYATLSGGVNMYVPTVTPPIPGARGDLVTATRNRLGANAGAGYILSKDLPIDLRAQVMLFNLIGQDERLNETEDIGVAFTAGYTLQF